MLGEPWSANWQVDSMEVLTVKRILGNANCKIDSREGLSVKTTLTSANLLKRLERTLTVRLKELTVKKTLGTQT
jgi:hypothetical protein